MDRDFVKDEVTKRLAHVHECVLALKCAKEAIPHDGQTQVNGVNVYCMVSVLTEAACSALDIATEDLIEYMSSWQD